MKILMGLFLEIVLFLIALFLPMKHWIVLLVGLGLRIEGDRVEILDGSRGDLFVETGVRE